MMRKEILPETLVSSCNQLTRQTSREDFIGCSRRESCESHNRTNNFPDIKQAKRNFLLISSC